jgi:hypothetical protein
VGKSGVAFYEAGLELYNQPSKGHGSTIIRKIPIGTKLFIDKELSGGWYHIALSSGEYGYVDATKVNTRLPDPGAQLYKVQDGQKVIGIAERYYKQFVQPGRDLRFYVNVLEEVNRQGGGIYRPPNTSWKDTQAKAGIHIWIPSAAFANTFDGKLSSGSSVRDALKQAGNVAKTVGNFAVGGASFIAGQLHGALESVWSNLTGIKDLAVMVWDILKSIFTGNLFNDGQNLWNSLTQTNWGDLAQAWLGDFNKKWNNPDLMQKWHFRGWVLGYAAAEIAIAILTAGGATGAKWAGKMSTKAIEVIKKIPGVAKLASQVSKVPVPAPIKKSLEQLRKIQIGKKTKKIQPGKGSALTAATTIKKLYKVSSQMREKILWGQQKGNAIIGGHFRGLLEHPSYAAEIVGVSAKNPGCIRVKFVKKLPNGSLSKIKSPASTLFPKGWSKSDIIKAIEDVANNPQNSWSRIQDKTTFMQGQVKGVHIEVIVDSSGSISAGYPL